MHNSTYEHIREIVEENVSDVAQPQLEKNIPKNINNLNSNKKYNNINKKSNK